MPNVTIYVNNDGSASTVSGSVERPRIVSAAYNEDHTFNVSGVAIASNDVASIKAIYSSALITRVRKRCIETYGWLPGVNNAKLTACFARWTDSQLRQVVYKVGKVSSSKIRLVDHNNSAYATEFDNQSAFQKNNISFSNPRTTTSIRAASKIRISGSITGSSFVESEILQSESTDSVNLSSQDATIFNGAVSPVSDPSCAGIQVTSEFGEARSITLIDENGNPYVWNNVHDGIDFALPEHRTCDIVSVNTGMLSKNYSYGDAAKVVHNSTYSTLYGHGSAYLKNDGQVEKGEKIIHMGSTGRSTGNHLHFMIYQNGNAINPRIYFNF